MILVIVGLLPSCFGWYKNPFIFEGFHADCGYFGPPCSSNVMFRYTTSHLPPCDPEIPWNVTIPEEDEPRSPYMPLLHLKMVGTSLTKITKLLLKHEEDGANIDLVLVSSAFQRLHLSEFEFLFQVCEYFHVARHLIKHMVLILLLKVAKPIL